MKVEFVKRLVVFVCALSLAAGCLSAATPLPKHYKDWLNSEISYLITDNERHAFLALTTDQERDEFMDRFWAIRNPSPGTGTNEFKEEFYRRVAYANMFYSHDAGTEGWRTDRGKTYILFGKPQTTMNYNGNQELYPTELWFYSNPGLSELPAFFYVLFYERDGAGGYRVYSPYTDGPERLVRSGLSRSQAYNYLRNTVGGELARATLTYIPGEPVDPSGDTGSMGSMMIVNAIHGYHSMPSYVSLINSRLSQLALVKSHVTFNLAQTNLVTFVVHEKGEPWLHWEVEVRDPLHAKGANGHVRYNIRARLYSGSRMVFERSDHPEFNVPADAAGKLSARPFIYEDRAPVVDGLYRLEVQVHDELGKRLYEASRDFRVEKPADRAAMSDVVFVTRQEPDQRDRSFQFAGVKFFPSAAPRLNAAAGLRVLYQVVLPDSRRPRLGVEYTIGNLATHFRQTSQDVLDTSLADPSGALLTSKSLSIAELPPGNYQLSVRLKDPATGKIAGSSGVFSVVEGEREEQPIVVSPVHPPTPEWRAATEYERALCWLAQDRPEKAVAALESSRQLSPNPTIEALLDHLRASRPPVNRQAVP